MREGILVKSNYCFVPFVHAAMIWTSFAILSYRCSMTLTRFALILIFHIVALMATCPILSKAFIQLLKTWYIIC